MAWATQAEQEAYRARLHFGACAACGNRRVLAEWAAKALCAECVFGVDDGWRDD